ncbi:adenylate/guanylate cyclase domain-containing protein [Polycladidibacter stylochi]|uniref:adenylate/guanylate cyclase domain-containing protein n=1 Tax=Polycladidibacter stylochi TaxID=1807766 RepID=UPI0008323B7D|nr:adenylate/guanylate cyclase domain-containing protein [Pseudovibrio stylochi]
MNDRPNNTIGANNKKKRRKQARIPIGMVLGGGFGLLLFISAGAIIWLLNSSAERQTVKIMRELGELLLERSRAVVAEYVEHEEQNAQLIADIVVTSKEQIVPGTVRQHLEEALKKHTNIHRITYTDRHGRFISVNLRNLSKPPIVQWETRPRPQQKNLQNNMIWSPPFYDSELQQTYLRLTLYKRQGNGYEKITFDYPSSQFQSLLKRMVWREGQQPFILFRENLILASATLPEQNFKPSAKSPSLKILQINSPLNKIWQQDRSFARVPVVFGAHLSDVSWATINKEATKSVRTLYLYTPVASKKENERPHLPLIVGSYLPAKALTSPMSNLQEVAGIAAIILLAATLITMWLGNKLSRPVSLLAKQAQALRHLELDRLTPLPNSHIKEIHEANETFNAAGSALAAFARYVPQDLVKVLLQSDFEGLKGTDIRKLTIMFTDIVGFTRIASNLSAKDTTSLLNAHFQELAECISQSHGTIDKYIGDGIMAFWGAPQDVDNHAQAALQAVQLIAERIESNHIDKQKDSFAFRLRVGLHTGTVVVGNIGTSERMNYTVIGDNVNVAARLQELGKTVDPEAKIIVLASESTIEELNKTSISTTERHAPNEFKIVGEFQLRGREQPMKVYRLV